MKSPGKQPEVAERASRLTIAFMAAPYAAVLWGLYWLHSAWWAILLYHVCIVLYLRIAKPPELWTTLRAGWQPRSGLGLSLVCAGAGPVFFLLWPLMADEPTALGSILAGYGLQGSSWWLFVIYFATVHSVLEEAFWRTRPTTLTRGNLFGDLAFAGYHFLVLRLFVHLFWTILAVFVLVCIAWMWRRTTDQLGGAAVPVISHAIAGISILAAAGMLSR